MAFAYPLMLNLTGRRVVIVGGGNVAARKAAGLLAAGADDVLAVAPRFIDAFPVGVRRMPGLYEPAHLNGAGLVFAATDSPAVNAAVVRDAHERNLLACRADGDEEMPGDFSTPAVFRDGPIVVTVSAGGSPVLAGKIRDELAQSLSRDWASFAEALQQLRPALLSDATLNEPQRRELFRALASDEARAAHRRGELEQFLQSKIEILRSKIHHG